MLLTKKISRKFRKITLGVCLLFIFLGTGFSNTLGATAPMSKTINLLAPTNVIDIVLIDRSSITIDIQVGGIVTIQLINTEDEVVYDVNITNESEYIIDVSTFPSGTYTLSAKSGNDIDNEVITL